MTSATDGRLSIVVLCPHFDPDTAPTGVVMSRLVRELTLQGHRVHVVTTLPWYRDHRVDSRWTNVGWRNRTETTPWGSITRLQPFAGTDRRNLLRRAAGFVGFSGLATVAAVSAGRRTEGRRPDAVIAMSPPLTLGVAAWIVARVRRAPLIFNVQDVFPDAAVATGAIRNRWVIRASRLLEKFVYRRSAAITVLSDELADNVRGKLPRRMAGRVVTIPNFVDTSTIVPMDRGTRYRTELGLDDRPVVMYAGNVGFSQSLDLLIGAARKMPDVWFVVNGGGSALESVRSEAEGLANLVFGDFQPIERLAEVLATGDVHVVPLKRGLGSVSVPSKTYSIMAAGRPVVAAIDEGTEVRRLIERSGGGLSVAPDDAEAFVDALRRVVGDPVLAGDMGRSARRLVEGEASPRSVATAYADLIGRMAGFAG